MLGVRLLQVAATCVHQRLPHNGTQGFCVVRFRTKPDLNRVKQRSVLRNALKCPMQRLRITSKGSGPASTEPVSHPRGAVLGGWGSGKINCMPRNVLKNLRCDTRLLTWILGHPYLASNFRFNTCMRRMVCNPLRHRFPSRRAATQRSETTMWSLGMSLWHTVLLIHEANCRESNTGVGAFDQNRSMR